MTDRTAFITGSQAYGTPTDKSDVDFVIWCSEESRKQLVELAKNLGEDIEFDPNYDSEEVAQFKIGWLNLILVCRHEEFEAWQQGTALLRARQPVTRDDAVKQFKALFAVAKAARAESAIL